MKSLIKHHQDMSKMNGEHPCNTGCPFEIEYSRGECMHCYELFPGWGDFYLDADSMRGTTEFFDHNNIPWEFIPACPCHTLGEEFVAWRIALFMEKGI